MIDKRVDFLGKFCSLWVRVLFYIWSIVCIFNLSAAINVNITLLHFNMKTVEREFKSSHQKEKKFVFI